MRRGFGDERNFDFLVGQCFEIRHQGPNSRAPNSGPILPVEIDAMIDDQLAAGDIGMRRERISLAAKISEIGMAARLLSIMSFPNRMIGPRVGDAKRTQSAGIAHHLRT